MSLFGYNVSDVGHEKRQRFFPPQSLLGLLRIIRIKRNKVETTLQTPTQIESSHAFLPQEPSISSQTRK